MRNSKMTGDRDLFSGGREKKFPITFTGIFAAAALATVFMAGAAGASTIYFQGFETDTTDWNTNTNRVASGTGGITSADGNFHAESLGISSWHFFGSGSTATSNATIPFTASLDFYLDMGGSWSNDTRFDYSVALTKPDGNHLRDFVFNAGFYNDDTVPGADSDRFVISASNSAGRGDSYPKNPGRDPISIDTTGWYTFQHAFFDDGGTLGAMLSVLDSGGTSLSSWSLGTDPIADVGGEGYGWIVNNEFDRLAYDNTSLTSGAAPVPVPATLPLLGGGLVLMGFVGWRKRRAIPA